MDLNLQYDIASTFATTAQKMVTRERMSKYKDLTELVHLVPRLGEWEYINHPSGGDALVAFLLGIFPKVQAIIADKPRAPRKRAPAIPEAIEPQAGPSRVPGQPQQQMMPPPRPEQEPGTASSSTALGKRPATDSPKDSPAHTRHERNPGDEL